MKEGVEAFGQVLEMLAGKLGVAAEYLLPLFARRQIGGAIAELLVVGATACAWWFRVRHWGENNPVDEYDRNDARIAGAIIGAIMLVIGCLLFLDAVATLASPQAAAIKSIMSACGDLLHGDD